MDRVAPTTIANFPLRVRRECGTSRSVHGETGEASVVPGGDEVIDLPFRRPAGRTAVAQTVDAEFIVRSGNDDFPMGNCGRREFGVPGDGVLGILTAFVAPEQRKLADSIVLCCKGIQPSLNVAAGGIAIRNNTAWENRRSLSSVDLNGR
jgi:hypothetical protein